MEKYYKRKEDESELSYIARMYRQKIELGLNNKEINVIINKELGTNYAESTTRGKADVYNKCLDEVLEKQLKKSDNELEKKLQELRIERKKIQTLNVERNKNDRIQAREELWYEQLENSIKNLKPLECPKIIINNNSKRDAVLTLADCHYGRECCIKGLEGEILYEYNTDIFKKYMWNLLGQVLKCCKERNLRHINIMALGDFIDGLLRVSQLNSLQTGVTDSVAEYSDFIATWLNELSKNVSIDYYQCGGNHDELRILTGKKGDFPHENVSKSILRHIKVRLENEYLKDKVKALENGEKIKNPNITIHDQGNKFIYFNLYGVNILGYHGEDKDLVNSMRSFRTMYRKPIDIVFGAHLHSNSLKTEGAGEFCNCEGIRVNGICGSDDYSYTLQKTSKAGANMYFFEEGRGKYGQEDFWLS